MYIHIYVCYGAHDLFLLFSQFARVFCLIPLELLVQQNKNDLYNAKLVEDIQLIWVAG